MLRKGFIAFVFAATLAANVFAADVVVRVAPPAPVVETRGSRPQAPVMSGRLDTIAGTAAPTCGPKASGLGRRTRMPIGWLIAGYTAMAAT